METTDTTTTAPINLTEIAAAKVKELLVAEGDESLALRIAVTGGGCSGFQYALGFDSDVQEDDQVLEQHGVRVLIDNTSAEYLSGAQVDFQDGLHGKGFAIENPNSKGSCGCGQSFSC